jgi:hypothetical protein
VSRAVVVTRVGAAIAFVGFAAGAWISGWILQHESPPATGAHDGTRQMVLAGAYALCACLSLASLTARHSLRVLTAPVPALLGAVILLNGGAFWLVDQSQKFPISEGSYGPGSVTLLGLATLALLAALTAATSHARPRGGGNAAQVRQGTPRSQ